MDLWLVKTINKNRQIDVSLNKFLSNDLAEFSLSSVLS